MQQKASNIKDMLSERWLQEIDPHILSYIRASHCMYTLHLHLVKKHGPLQRRAGLEGCCSWHVSLSVVLHQHTPSLILKQIREIPSSKLT